MIIENNHIYNKRHSKIISAYMNW